MKKQIAVIGLGRFGTSLALTLSTIGHDVLAMDLDEQKVQAIAGKAAHVVQADSTSETVLRELGIGNLDIAVVAIGTAIQNSVLTTILLKRLGVPFVIARANTDLHGEILSKIGADRVVYPENEMGIEVAHEAVLGAVSDYMLVSPGYGIAKAEAGDNFIGKTLTDIGAGPRGKLGIAVLLIQRENDVIVTPSLSELIKKGDIIIASGNDDKLAEFLLAGKPKKTDKAE